MSMSKKTIFTSESRYCGFSCSNVILDNTLTLSVKGTYELLDCYGNSQISEISYEDWEQFNIVSENSRDTVVFLTVKDAKNFLKNHKLGKTASVVNAPDYSVYRYTSCDSRHSEKVKRAIEESGWFTGLDLYTICKNGDWVFYTAPDQEQINKSLRNFYLGESHSDCHCGSCLIDLSQEDIEDDRCPQCGWSGII